MRTISVSAVATLAVAVACFPGRAPSEQPAKPPPKAAVPLFEGLGKHTRTVATSNPEAQQFFDQGLNFMFAFNHDEAIRAYRQAAELDPNFAMAYWGIALSSGVNINDPRFPPEKAKAALESLEQARAKSKPESPANRAIIEALVSRYPRETPKDTKPLEKAYSAAMKEVWERFPKDADIGALYAESLMNLRPWELWTADGKPAPETPAILAALEAVQKLAPDHPLANHLYIHAVEASPNPEKADEAANRLRGAQPALGHMLHMPSHIDIRRGRWTEAIEANRLAITADRKYQKSVPEQGYYRLYMAHNFHMLTFGAMMTGRSKLALDTIRDTFTDVPAAWLDAKENAPLADCFAGLPLEVLKRFGRWDDILKEPEPRESFPFSRAMRHHARGVAFAAKGQVSEARESQKAFRDAVKKVPEGAQVGNNTVADVLAIADDVLEGEILFREKKVKDAIALLERAAKKGDALRYSEPPDWFVPVRHALGAVLLHDGQAVAAEKVYREDLRQWPDNGWSLHGLAVSLSEQGKKDEAAKIREQFNVCWKLADVKIASSCYCVSD